MWCALAVVPPRTRGRRAQPRYRISTESSLYILNVEMPGFLPFRGSLMLDTVCVAMVGITIALAVSIYLVRYQRQERWHRTIQLVLASVLAVAVLAFELDLRLLTNWRELARESVYYPSGWVDRVLWIHLLFAIPTPLMWGAIIVSALRNYSHRRHDAKYWERHRWWGRLAAGMMFGTAVSGWVFYWIAFVA